eukprot:scaffold320839_cov19-Tisochrysis_lutea.AAC.1
MGRGTVPQIINHQCKIVVDAGLEWAQRDGVEGLVNPVGSEWTATGEKHMKEVVRKLVTASEWEDLQQSHYNLQGLSAQMLEDPKKWPHAARIQLEAWFVKQIRETRRRMKQAEAFSEGDHHCIVPVNMIARLQDDMHGCVTNLHTEVHDINWHVPCKSAVKEEPGVKEGETNQKITVKQEGRKETGACES